MDAAVIELKELSFSYQKAEVFKNLTFRCISGERIGIVGPNGSGKTTLFQLIMGLLKPAAGEVWIFGRRCQQEKDFRPLRLRIGYLFQNPDHQLFSPTVEEDIAFGPFNQGRDREEIHQIVHRTCEILGLEGFEERIPYHLSWGEKKLVALATIVAMDPELYLMDEPTAGLDEEVTERLMSFLRRNNKTLIIASHDREFLTNCTDKLYLLKNGILTLL